MEENEESDYEETLNELERRTLEDPAFDPNELFRDGTENGPKRKWMILSATDDEIILKTVEDDENGTFNVVCPKCNTDHVARYPSNPGHLFCIACGTPLEFYGRTVPADPDTASKCLICDLEFENDRDLFLHVGNEHVNKNTPFESEQDRENRLIKHLADNVPDREDIVRFLREHASIHDIWPAGVPISTGIDNLMEAWKDTYSFDDET